MAAGCAIWLTGLPASGKTTIALALAERLRAQGHSVETLDGDEIRLGLSADLGFSAEDRQQHNRRVIFVSKLLIRNGIVVLIPLISPYRETRAYARCELEPFVEVSPDSRTGVSEIVMGLPSGRICKFVLPVAESRSDKNGYLTILAFR